MGSQPQQKISGEKRNIKSDFRLISIRNPEKILRSVKVVGWTLGVSKIIVEKDLWNRKVYEVSLK